MLGDEETGEARGFHRKYPKETCKVVLIWVKYVSLAFLFSSSISVCKRNDLPLKIWKSFS